MGCSKKILTMISITLLNIMIVSCSSNNSQSYDDVQKSNKPPKTHTINLMTTWGGADSKAGVLKEIIAKFEEENPNIKISNQSIFGDDYLPTLKTKFASGSEPDVFGLWPGSDIKYLIKADKIADITDTLKQDRTWMDSFDQASFMATTYNNRIYGIPYELVFEGLFINKDLFDEYGVKEPANYKELKDAVAIFKKNGIIPIAYNSTAEGSYIYQNIIASLGGSQGVEEYLVDGKINNCYIDAMKYMKELYDIGAFSEDSMMIYSDERNDLFFTKKAAMIVQGSWFIPYFEKDDTSVKMIPFPSMTDEDSKMPTGLGGGTFFISKNAWNSFIKRDDAIVFLKYLTSKESASYFYNTAGMLTYLNMEMDFQSANSLLAEQSTGVYKRILSKNKTPIPDHIIERSAWEDIVIKQFPKFLLGEKTAEEIWDQVVDKISN
ncbi:sugar ABC transporter substrate-binding protein [Ruminiclostridium herbifermentans]|uniref:Sugar ABC transporter substrate-binding protein n=1 Tax=Ruminiclostridium herbifermentans TaxID=2488810 RepID=A0A4U7JNK6_9FIRM|nr:sugar ABC transporter substrate-binding protein [Ruminiclostridium herbifermentans]QNU68332.1 sugar ABC transporter substrate-binding protein [Ruminiclostridium herbifermentans]